MPEPRSLHSDQRPYEYRTRTISEYGRPSTPNSSLLRQKDTWLKAAHESTEHFKQHGSPLPLVWVLTEDSNIPPNAVPFSEDSNGYPLYIARVRLEGQLYLGKAGRGFNGAAINYAGREHIVSKYEVLVCASLLRWEFPSLETNNVLQQGTVILAQQHRHEQHMLCSNVNAQYCNTSLRFSDVPRYVLRDHHREFVMRRLTEIKTVMLVDEAISAGPRNLWIQAKEALGGLVDIANRHGPRGVNLHFIHHDEYFEDVQTKGELIKLFDEVLPVGVRTPTGAKLEQVIEYYLPLVESLESTHDPMTIIVLTDRRATDSDYLTQSIATAAHRLEHGGAKRDAFTIQFVQIGTDEATARELRALDNNLVTAYNARGILNAVPFSHAHSVFDTEYLLKVLFRGIRKDLDRIPSNNILPVLPSTPIGVAPSSPRSFPSPLSGRTTTTRVGSPALSLSRLPTNKVTPVVSQQHSPSSNDSLRHRDAVLRRLTEIKTVILLDDSVSMAEKTHWTQAQEALGGILEMVDRNGPKGIDLHFMNYDGFSENLVSKDDAVTLFGEVQPVGLSTPIGSKLAQIIDYYMPRIESKDSTHEPIVIIVITDGAASDHDELVQTIVAAAHRLENAGVKTEMFGIQFVQIGTDEAAAEALRALDDNLATLYNIRDIVDTTPFDPAHNVFDTEYMLKILLGGNRKELDINPNPHPHRLPRLRTT